MMTKGMSHLILVLGLMTTIVHQLPEEKRRRKITKLVNSKIKLINDLAKKCQNNGPQMSLMKVIEDMIGIDNLNDKMDQNKQLIAFTNGVYDLSLFTFRQGLPEDYITRQMTIPYDITLTMENPKVIKMLNFLKKYFQMKNCLSILCLKIVKCI